MKIASFNINNVNKRLTVLLRWLREAKPDAVCLQELKCDQQSFPVTEIATAGYQAAWVGQKTWNGVAILSKGDIELDGPTLKGYIGTRLGGSDVRVVRRLPA